MTSFQSEWIDWKYWLFTHIFVDILNSVKLKGCRSKWNDYTELFWFNYIVKKMNKKIIKIMKHFLIIIKWYSFYFINFLNHYFFVECTQFRWYFDLIWSYFMRKTIIKSIQIYVEFFSKNIKNNFHFRL